MYMYKMGVQEYGAVMLWLIVMLPRLLLILMLLHDHCDVDCWDFQLTVCETAEV